MINTNGDNLLTMFDYVNLGDYDKAIERANSLETVNARQGGIAMVALSMARNGKFLEARQLANTLLDPTQIENVIAKIDSTESQEVQKTVRKVGRVTSVSSNLNLKAQGLPAKPEQDKFTEPYKVRRVTSVGSNLSLKAQGLPEKPEKDKFIEALEIIENYKNNTIKGLKLQSLARGMYKIGDLGKAKIAAEKIPDPILMNKTLQEIHFKRGPVKEGKYEIIY